MSNSKTNQSIPTPELSRWKLPARYTPQVFAFYMAAIMAFLMSTVIVAANGGIKEDFLARVLNAYKLAMPVAFCCVLLVRPLVMKLVAMTVRK
ncbi:DUF2798 domain-containing protein [Undibacterium sp. Ren11W]|uniref:DUF2798 domain-containing protein n=1 Tax=Undibacterium sp. Ren11W TaxID=3413045 RepID=UPI003BF37AED